MRTTEKDLLMLTSDRALRLNDILEILNTLRECLIYDRKIDIDEKKLVDGFRDIEVLNKYIYLSDIDFAKEMLKHIGITFDGMDKVIEECLGHYTDYENSFELDVPVYRVFDASDKIDMGITIRDISNKKESLRSYETNKIITYDFILKLQSKIWNGILDDYYSIDFSDFEEPYIALNFKSVQQYDEEYMEGINCRDYHDEFRNWAIAHNFVAYDDAVQMIYLDGKYIVSFSINI